MLILRMRGKQATGLLRRMRTVPMFGTLWVVTGVFEKEVAELEEKGNRRAPKKKLEKQTFPGLEHRH